jgi:hypothetical protein
VCFQKIENNLKMKNTQQEESKKKRKKRLVV